VYTDEQACNLYLRVICFPIIIPLSWAFFLAQDAIGRDGTIEMQILLSLLGCLQIYLLLRKGKQDRQHEEARERAAAALRAEQKAEDDRRRKEEKEERERIARELKEEQERVAAQLRERMEMTAAKTQEVREVVEQRVAAQLDENSRMTKEAMEDTKRSIGSIDNLNRMFMEFAVSSNTNGNGHHPASTTTAPTATVESIKETVEVTKDMVEEIKERGVGDGREGERPGS
jgi:hypothetical protein